MEDDAFYCRVLAWFVIVLVGGFVTLASGCNPVVDTLNAFGVGK